MTKNTITDSQHEFIFYNSPQDGKVRIHVNPYEETVWVTQKQMSAIFGVDDSGISRHLKNIFETGELVKNSVVAKFATTGSDGKTYNDVLHYNLDAVISVGYRVNSHAATQFRVWATEVLREYLIKGFALDKERLKQGSNLFDKDYFDELLEQIKEIRASERRFYQKVTDLYTLSADYNKTAPLTQDFFASVQNKLHWAISGKTAAEIVFSSASASSDNMGLSTWKNAPSGKILKTDAYIAKNYLSVDKIKELEGIVSTYLDLAENRAKRGIVTNMADWSSLLDNFLTISEYDVLKDKGSVSAEKAKAKAAEEFLKFRVEQDRQYVSDFDEAVEYIRVNGDLPSSERESHE